MIFRVCYTLRQPDGTTVQTPYTPYDYPDMLSLLLPIEIDLKCYRARNDVVVGMQVLQPYEGAAP